MPNPGDAEEPHNAFSVQVWDSKEFTIKALRKINPTDQCELDSHAETIVGGANCILLETSGETANVHSFSHKRKAFSNVPIGTIATAWFPRKPVKSLTL
jgi:hypothetical protein